MSPAVSQGILSLVGQRVLSATSAMVLSPHWPQDALALKPMSSHLDVGLHLDWTSAFAHHAGHGMSLPEVMARSLTGAWRKQDLLDALERQFDAFEDRWQAPPDHIDGHQHVHQMNGIRQALMTVLARRYPRTRPWIRVSRSPTALRSAKSVVVAAWGAQALHATLTQAHWPASPWLTGMYDFSGTVDRYAMLCDQWLTHAPHGSVLMCHPAQARDPADAIDLARTQEHTYLIGPQFMEATSRTGVALVRGTQVLHTP